MTSPDIRVGVASRERQHPLVSVVIPTRDRRHYLALTLRSVLRQRDVDFEIVVVDDASRDETHEMVESLDDPRVRVVRNESPRGESGARNRGVAEANGTWIAFLDDDDLWAPLKLNRQLDSLRETGREWAYCGDVVIDSELRILYGAPPPNPDEVMESLGRHNSVPAGASNVIAGASLLARVGPFDGGLKRTTDWDMWLRFAKTGPPASVQSPLVANCIHSGNMFRDMAVMFRELDVVASRYGVPVDRARHYRWAAWEALIEGRRSRALRYYAGAVAEGDLRSIGRAALAILRPSPRRRPTAATDSWTAEARAWIDELRQCVEH